MQKLLSMCVIMCLLIMGMLGVIKGGDETGSNSILDRTAIQSSDSVVNPLFSDPKYTCGDADGSGMVNASDATRIFNYAMDIGPAPEEDVLSGNADGQLGVNIL